MESSELSKAETHSNDHFIVTVVTTMQIEHDRKALLNLFTAYLYVCLYTEYIRAGHVNVIIALTY